MHVLLIPDGDRRYAKKHNLSLREAYEQAARTARSLVEWILVDDKIN
jgi:undecaprenyl pyrophosphate synthase